MSDTFNPGDGWREVEQDEWYSSKTESLALEKGTHDKAARYWVRVPPVPPLPTAPYTVIRVTWRSTEFPGMVTVLTLEDGEWRGQKSHTRVLVSPETLAADITGWEPLAEPRAATAKTVLDRVGEWVESRGEDPDHELFGRAAIAREFGVDA